MHEADGTVKQYTDALWNDSKNKIVNQMAPSSKRNMLYLGVWLSLRSAVEKAHQMKIYNSEAFAHSVIEAWDKLLNESVFVRGCDRLKEFLVLIGTANGGNEMVECKLVSDAMQF